MAFLGAMLFGNQLVHFEPFSFQEQVTLMLALAANLCVKCVFEDKVDFISNDDLGWSCFTDFVTPAQSQPASKGCYDCAIRT
jgi:hypothetical protein